MPENAGSWLTKEEKQVAIQRTRQSGNTDEKRFDKKQFLAAIIDYKIWLAGNIICHGMVIEYSLFIKSRDLHWFECSTC